MRSRLRIALLQVCVALLAVATLAAGKGKKRGDQELRGAMQAIEISYNICAQVADAKQIGDPDFAKAKTEAQSIAGLADGEPAKRFQDEVSRQLLVKLKQAAQKMAEAASNKDAAAFREAGRQCQHACRECHKQHRVKK